MDTGQFCANNYANLEWKNCYKIVIYQNRKKTEHLISNEVKWIIRFFPFSVIILLLLVLVLLFWDHLMMKKKAND